jgi:D-xylose transport system permease protein
VSLERAIPVLPGGNRLDVILSGRAAMAGVLALMWAVLAILPATRGVFLTQGNITSLLSQSAVLLVVAVGMTMVIIIKGIDLSIGAGVALTGTIAALCHAKLGLPAPVAMLAALAAGAAIGAWHGWWVGWLGIPAFVVTLAGFKAYRGGALVLSDAHSMVMGDDFAWLAGTLPATATWAVVGGAVLAGASLTLRDAQRRKQFALAPVPPAILAAQLAALALLAVLLLALFGSRGMPMLVVIAGAVAVAGAFITKRTRFGRHLYAIGGNAEAARLSGVDVKRVTMGVYMILGLLTALAGLMLAARVNGVTPGAQGANLELDAITAVVIGGTSLLGGRGSVVGTVLGTLVFATLANGMNLLRIDSNLQWIFTGAILLAAVLIDVLSKGKRS